MEKDEVYLLHPKKDIGKISFTGNEYSSKDFCLSRSELFDYLEGKDFFRKQVI